MILAGDIGGTKTWLALYAPGGDPRRPLRRERFVSADHPSFEAMVAAFLGERERVEHAVVGVAGPVVDEHAEATNLPWDVAAARLREALGGARVHLLNDLEATAWAVAELPPDALRMLQPGEVRSGHRAVIAAGTGLGEALLPWDGSGWRPLPSEGGHADFAPTDALEDELLGWLRSRHGRVSWERVLSGPGLADLYRFLAETGRGEEAPELGRRVREAADPAPIIADAALDGSSPRARLAVERFCSIYGGEAGNLALKGLATGGVFVGGGMAPRLLPALEAGGFIRAFTAKGRMAPLLARIPVAVIRDASAALWGAARVALAFGERG